MRTENKNNPAESAYDPALMDALIQELQGSDYPEWIVDALIYLNANVQALEVPTRDDTFVVEYIYPH